MWQQLIFPHIPKTAGWALHAALLPIFGEANSFRVNDGNDLAQLRALSPAEFARYRYLSGHFTFADIQPRCGADAVLVSVLRDPVRRLVSEFNYLASWTEHPYHSQFKDLRLSQHVRNNAAFIRGTQCHWLTGHRNADRAMAVIRENYALVGTVGDYGAFLAALGRLIGQEIPAGRSNVTQGQGMLDFDSDLCSTLLDLTTEDRMLVERIASFDDGVFVGARPGTLAA
jgi:hypothetical protein